MTELKIGVSGKRLVNASDEKYIAAEFENRIKQILKQHNRQSFTGYSSMAIGADTIFADVVTRVFKMPLCIVLPLPVDEYEKDFSDGDKQILHQYIEKYGVEKQIKVTVPNISWQRNSTYFEAGKYLTNHCNEMIFLWDGMKPSGEGGTADVIGYYAAKHNKYPVDYIPVNSVSDDELEQQINTILITKDSEALQNRDNYKAIWQLALALGLVSVVLFAINMAFGKYFEETGFKILKLIFSGAELLLVSVVFVLIAKAKAKNYHRRYLSARMEAETLRVLQCYYHSGISFTAVGVTENMTTAVNDIVSRINNSVAGTAFTAIWYSDYVIKMLIHNQLVYHSGRLDRIGGKFHLLEKANSWVAILFILNMALHFTTEALEYCHVHFFEYSPRLATLFSILLPALYAAIEGFSYFQEWGQLKKISYIACDYFKRLLTMWNKSTGDTEEEVRDKQVQILNSMANFMITERKDWNLLFEGKSNYHQIV